MDRRAPSSSVDGRALSQTSPDYLEGVSAFQAKRPANFQYELPGTRFENVAPPDPPTR
jgi:hypothetical protein